MNKTKKIKIHISGVIISFQGTSFAMEYLLREFADVVTNEQQVEDLEIAIINETFRKPQKVDLIAKQLYVKNNKIMQCIRSKRNEIWVETTIQKGLPRKVNLYIPYEISDNISKMFHPAYLCKWQISLVNFVHGPFLGMMELLLLERNASYFHASAFRAYGEGGILLTGYGQVGKSTFVKWITNDNKNDIISEDFCIINSEKEVIPYSKQSRIRLQNKSDFEQYRKEVGNYSIMDQINYSVFKLLKRVGIHPIRILSVSEMFSNYKKVESIQIKDIYCMKREGTTFDIKAIEKNEFIEFSEKNLEIEFNNMIGVSEWLKALEAITKTKELKDQLSEKRKKIFESVFEKVNCRAAYIPYNENMEDTKKMVMDLVNQTYL